MRVRVSTCQHAYVRIRKLLCIFVYVKVSFYMPVRACACVCACVRAYERASMRVCVQLRHNDTHAGGQNYVAI